MRDVTRNPAQLGTHLWSQETEEEREGERKRKKKEEKNDFFVCLLLKIQKGFGNNQHHKQQAKSMPTSSMKIKTCICHTIGIEQIF